MQTVEDIIAHPPVPPQAIRPAYRGDTLSLVVAGRPHKTGEDRTRYLLGFGLTVVLGTFFFGVWVLNLAVLVLLGISAFFGISRRRSTPSSPAHSLRISPTEIVLRHGSTETMAVIAIRDFAGCSIDWGIHAKPRLGAVEDAHFLTLPAAYRAPSICFFRKSGGFYMLPFDGLFSEWESADAYAPHKIAELEWGLGVVEAFLHDLRQGAPMVVGGATVALDQARANLLGVLRNAPAAVASPFEIDAESALDPIADTSAW
ncbi:hypothetical protein [Bradymonas sediminis]|uniref:Uncharacterized protein n=1 Tax=Bradymonas sediminis TaxID=1548548 RepID=A0A2Z4FMY1_9DELT|nr:hypothetical protein [Bradymonas sediminis]AWV90044.1 hypothetical protein DN745_12120 [Bradymonas sediminis]TDP75997.1 hypothetical protein DFR33_103346 [Bradymonas sediminis]